MSVLGHRQTFRSVIGMSALPPKADMCSAPAHVCFGPIADIAHLSHSGHRSTDVSHARFNRMIDCATGIDPILEGAQVVDFPIAHVLEHLSAQSGATAGRTIQDDYFVFSKVLVVVRRFGIGPKLQAIRARHRPLCRSFPPRAHRARQPQVCCLCSSFPAPVLA
jgi:hypothetical protein